MKRRPSPRGGDDDRSSPPIPLCSHQTESLYRPIEEMPALRIGTLGEHKLIARQLDLPDAYATVSASASGYLRLAEFPQCGEMTTGWLVIDPFGHVAELRHVSGPPLRNSQGLEVHRIVYGDRAWPVGASVNLSGKPVLFVRGAEDIIAAFLTFWEFFVVGMLDDVPISSEAMPMFDRPSIMLADLADPVAKRAFVGWRQQLSRTVRRVNSLRPVDYDGRRYYLNATGRTARNLSDWAATGYVFAEMGPGNPSN